MPDSAHTPTIDVDAQAPPLADATLIGERPADPVHAGDDKSASPTSIVPGADLASAPWRIRARRATVEAVPALALYEFVRLFSLAILWIFAHRVHLDVIHRLDYRFDATAYVDIANHGYDHSLTVGPDGHYLTSNLAFFPLYPALILVVKTITGLSAPVAGLVVSWAAGLAAAWGLFAVGRHLHSRRAGVILVVLWAALPYALVQSSAYTETLFTALCAWALLAVLRRQWLTAGVLAVFAGLTRPNANAVILVVCVAALVALVRRRDGWRPLVAMLIAPLGYLGYLAWVGVRLGHIDGYVQVEKKTWDVSFDGGLDTVRQFKYVLTRPENDFGSYVVIFVIMLTIMLFVLAVLNRQPWPLILYSAVSILFVLGAAGAFISKARYLMPVFPVLLPVAIGLAKGRLQTAIVVLSTLALASAWYGTYLVLVWKWSP